MLSWNELFDNLKGDVQDKSKNPFFGAFIVTWSIRNWELFFKVFDSDPKKGARIDVIKLYFDELPRFDFWITILYTFGVIILGYLFLNLARIISNLSEKILTPAIYKWTAGRGSIVLKEDYDKVLSREEKLKEKLQKEKQEKEQLESKIEELEKEVFELKKIKIENNKTEDKVNKEPEKMVKEFSKEPENDESFKIEKVFEKLKNKGLEKDFIKISAELLSGISQNKANTEILFFVSNKLIQFNGDDSSVSHGYGFYGLTDLGHKVLDRINEDVDF